MILIDTGPLVAFFDASDDYHHLCLGTLKDVRQPLATTWAVLTEAFYLLGFSWKAQDNLWEFVMRGGLEIMHLDARLCKRCRALMKKYRDLPMDLADGTLVAVAEGNKIEKIFTLDHKDFNIYRPANGKCFKILPTLL
ncbi:MAG: PIN domain-containing protein [Spirochaetales bacterium]|nr:PIN domain-containing protein [Spirochaetales bacterium]